MQLLFFKILELQMIKSASEISLWYDLPRTALNSQKNDLFLKVRYLVEKQITLVTWVVLRWTQILQRTWWQLINHCLLWSENTGYKYLILCAFIVSILTWLCSISFILLSLRSLGPFENQTHFSRFISLVMV